MPVVAWMLIATNKCFDMEHFAYSFALKNFLNCQVIGVPAPALIDGQCSLVVISKLDQLICFSSGQTKGLFRDHMLSCAQHLHGDSSMSVRWSRDYYNIYIWIFCYLRKVSAGTRLWESLARYL